MKPATIKFGAQVLELETKGLEKCPLLLLDHPQGDNLSLLR